MSPAWLLGHWELHWELHWERPKSSYHPCVFVGTSKSTDKFGY
jgi:hypothetical protein